MKNKTLILSVSLGTGCYKHVKISSGATLFDLHEFILDSFSFVDDHLHAFFMNNRAWDDSSGYYAPASEDEERFTTDYKLNDFPLEKGAKFLYIFDFGDEWRFSIKVLRTEDQAVKKPEVMKSVGEAPPQYGYDDDEEDAFALHNPSVDSDGLTRPLSAEEQKRADLLDAYALAAVNLYGVISQDEFIAIFNSQNDKKTDAGEVFSTLLRYVRDDGGYCFFEGGIAHESFDEDNFELVDDLLNQAGNKPRFIPPKEKFLRFADEMYTDNPLFFARIRKFLEDAFGANENVLGLYFDIFTSCSKDKTFNDFMDLLQKRGLQFDSPEQMKIFIALITEAQNNSRLWVNKGHTPTEMLEIYRRLPERGRVKVGRNAPCPCGSGKKYKRCCGSSGAGGRQNVRIK